MLKDIRRSFGATQNNRLALGLPMAGGIEQSAFERNFSVMCKKRSFQALGTIRHEELL